MNNVCASVAEQKTRRNKCEESCYVTSTGCVERRSVKYCLGNAVTLHFLYSILSEKHNFTHTGIGLQTLSKLRFLKRYGTTSNSRRMLAFNTAA